MDQKQIPQDQTSHIGFQPPPAYDQHQFQPQQPYQHQSIPQHSIPVQNQPQVVTVITGDYFGPNPKSITCSSCRQNVVTRVDFESSTKTHLVAAVICLVFWPCVCVPYLTDSCKNANHYCPHCGAYLGSYRG
ncbi:CLUMA_CG014488, isoform A [Clunio marinus]|uniref:CLUMA_CG014488, isoform A n=1 Tax=Clunio marinus TaxID=568069 RepID=A0A1J1ILK7_9DIPT|nr:CLUMA_CG014488, isoform A [Clunio marinus]